MRFRRRAKLFPGVYLNFSKSGISTTIGFPGASINFNKNGTYLNTGIPGTGLYDRQKIGGSNKGRQNVPLTDTENGDAISTAGVGEIKTDQAEATTTEGLQELKKTLIECYQERNELKKEILKAKTRSTVATILMVFSYILIVGVFIKWFKVNKIDKEEALEDLEGQLADCFVNIDMDVFDQIDKKYLTLLEHYRKLLTCARIWDVTSSVAIDRRTTRSAAGTAITRRPVRFGFGNINIIRSKYEALHFENANGGDIYIYPAFIAIVDAHKRFGLVDIRELDFNFHGQRFLEEEQIPADAAVVDHTWAKVNKNGSPDKRFKDNYRIPICQYGDIELKSATGLNESYSFSSYDKSAKFAEAMMEYKKVIK
jgi:hypothetical protein